MTGKRDINGIKIRHKQKKRKQDAMSAADVDNADEKKPAQVVKNATKMVDADDTIKKSNVSGVGNTSHINNDTNNVQDAMKAAADMDDADKKKHAQVVKNAANMDDADDGINMTNVSRVGDPSNVKDDDQGPGDESDVKDAGITTEGEDAGRSANEQTQDKTMVSQFGNLSELEKFPRNAANMDKTDDGGSKERNDNLEPNDTSNDAKDADVTTKADDRSGSANDSTQVKKKVSQSGNFSKLEKFPRLTLTY